MNNTLAEILTAHIRVILEMNDPGAYAYYDEKDDNAIKIHNTDLKAMNTTLSLDSLVQISNYLTGFRQANFREFVIVSEQYNTGLQIQSIIKIQIKKV